MVHYNFILCFNYLNIVSFTYVNVYNGWLKASFLIIPISGPFHWLFFFFISYPFPFLFISSRFLFSFKVWDFRSIMVPMAPGSLGKHPFWLNSWLFEDKNTYPATQHATNQPQHSLEYQQAASFLPNCPLSDHNKLVWNKLLLLSLLPLGLCKLFLRKREGAPALVGMD